MIRVGVDAWNLPGDRRGIGRYLREILRVWRERYRERVDVSLIVPEWHAWTVAERYRREAGAPYRVVSRRFHDRAGFDVLWFPFNGCSWTSFRAPAVATLHDASNFVLPDYAPETQIIFRNAAERCRGLLTVSEFQRHELARVLDLPLERITAIPLGVAAPRPARDVALDVRGLGSFALYVGAPEARKGFDVLLRAMALVARTRRDLSLVATTRVREWRALLDGVTLRAVDYVDDDTLAALYRGCALTVFPSRYEGFGLPILEAMSYGAPVVASNASAIPETAGDAACYVPAADPEALAAAVLRVAGDAAYASELRARGLRRASAFSWERTASETLAALEAAAG